MLVKVKLFAAAAETAGARELDVDLPQGATAGDLWKRLMETYRGLSSLDRGVALAVNQEYAGRDTPLSAGDEVGILPPVSGGTGGGHGNSPAEKMFLVTDTPISVDETVAKVNNPHAGAMIAFIGIVREFTRGKRTIKLEYDAYPPMAQKKLAEIGQEIRETWPGAEIAITHRIGPLEIGAASVVIAVATPHRQDAYPASRLAIERLKQTVPIWKKEVWEDGSAWVGPVEEEPAGGPDQPA